MVSQEAYNYQYRKAKKGEIPCCECRYYHLDEWRRELGERGRCALRGTMPSVGKWTTCRSAVLLKEARAAAEGDAK